MSYESLTAMQHAAAAKFLHGDFQTPNPLARFSLDELKEWWKREWRNR